MGVFKATWRRTGSLDPTCLATGVCVVRECALRCSANRLFEYYIRRTQMVCPRGWSIFFEFEVFQRSSDAFYAAVHASAGNSQHPSYLCRSHMVEQESRDLLIGAT